MYSSWSNVCILCNVDNSPTTQVQTQTLCSPNTFWPSETWGWRESTVLFRLHRLSAVFTIAYEDSTVTVWTRRNIGRTAWSPTATCTSVIVVDACVHVLSMFYWLCSALSDFVMSYVRSCHCESYPEPQLADPELSRFLGFCVKKRELLCQFSSLFASLWPPFFLSLLLIHKHTHSRAFAGIQTHKH